MKNPHLQLQEAIFEISKIAYETDDFFKEIDAQLEHYKNQRDIYIKDLEFFDPSKRAQQKLIIDRLTCQIEDMQVKLREYLETCFRENGKVEIEEPDQEKLDAAFAKAKIAHERVYLVYKHTRPELLEKFTPIATSSFSPEETEEFFKRIARRETRELDEILASLKDDGTSLRP